MSLEQFSEKKKMKRKDYEEKLRQLQVELCHLQSWVKSEGSYSRGATLPARAERSGP
jgi:polyphosphate kinase 2 (PPK2 family)